MPTLLVWKEKERDKGEELSCCCCCDAAVSPSALAASRASWRQGTGEVGSGNKADLSSLLPLPTS